jgi:hypothetical protein
MHHMAIPTVHLDIARNSVLNGVKNLLRILIARISRNMLTQSTDKSEGGAAVGTLILVIFPPISGITVAAVAVEDPIVDVVETSLASAVARLQVYHHGCELRELTVAT